MTRVTRRVGPRSRRTPWTTRRVSRVTEGHGGSQSKGSAATERWSCWSRWRGSMVRASSLRWFVPRSLWILGNGGSASLRRPIYAAAWLLLPRKSPPKQSLNLPDLDQARSAVLNSLPSKESQRGYRHAIDEFIAWYCSEPRLSFNKAVVTRYRIHLESRQLAPNRSEEHT